MRPSVLSALSEAGKLWRRHWVFLTLVALFLQFPGSLNEVIPHVTVPAWIVVKTAAVVVLSVIFQAAATAAVLTLLYREPTEQKWAVAAKGVYECTGRLVGVYIGLCLISFISYVPLAGVMLLFRLNPLLAISIGALFVVFLKFALANPLVVAENQRAWVALDASWRMTKNRFWFVLGSYLIFGCIEYGIGYAAIHLPFPKWSRWSLIRFVLNIIDTYWLVLPWVMYVQLRDAGDARFIVTTKTPPC